MAISNSLAALVKDDTKGVIRVSRISADLRGKVIVIYGGNNLGKTTQASKFKNPVFLPFEKGLNGIDGAIVLKNREWSDFKSNVKLLSSSKWLKVLKEEGQITVILDGFEKAGFYCQKYLESKYDVYDIAEANGGYGAWKQYEKEMWTEVNKLLDLGYTVICIGHAVNNKDKGKLYPAGDTRTITPIIDNADIVCYLQANGVDENNEEILSSAYLVETDEFFGRSRFTYVPKYIETFTAENLEKAIVDGINKQLELDNSKSVSYEEQQEIYEGDNYTYDEMLEMIKDLYMKCDELGLQNEYADIVTKHLGDGVLVSQATKNQMISLACIKNDLEDIVSNTEE